MDDCTEDTYKIEFEVDMGNLSELTDDDRVHSVVLFTCRKHKAAVREAAAVFMKESGYIKSVDSSGDIAYMRAVRAWEIAVQDHIQIYSNTNKTIGKYRLRSSHEEEEKREEENKSDEKKRGRMFCIPGMLPNFGFDTQWKIYVHNDEDERYPKIENWFSEENFKIKYTSDTSEEAYSSFHKMVK